MNSPRIDNVITCLVELKNESDVTKAFKEKAEKIIVLLTDTFNNEKVNSKNFNDFELVIEKALFMLEEINSLNLPPYYRTQTWDIISMLESIKAD